MNSTQTQSFDLAAMLAPTKAVEAYMGQCLDRRTLPANLREAARYSLLAPGKRLRPILVIRCCEAVGGKAEQAMAPAAAIEMIHAFSLIHDDLPALDNDDLRRGRPTLHKHTSEAMAILAGDLLMGLAFEVVLADLAPAELAARVTQELAKATNDMIAGQVYDTLPDFAPSVDPVTRLRTIHRNKTGALIRCACRMGALCGAPADESGKKKLQAITRYAEAVGLMFQVIDDLLDVTQTTEKLGKAAGKDAGQGKLTYPGLIGIDATKAEIGRLQTEAHGALTELGPAAHRLGELCDYMAVREK